MSERAPQDLEQRCINTIRFLSVDAVQKANSGHPGMPMGAAPAAYALWTKHLKVNPADPAWPDRDRFVLSAGHGSMLLYSLLHLCGFDLSLDDIKAFRQWGSRTPGHPEHGLTPGVETTTGPLGQGFANAVGMAIAEAALAARFNRPAHPVVDHFTYVMESDGGMMEGVGSEAASLAGHLGLGKLIVLYDDNHISIEGNTDIAFTEDVCARFAAYEWHTQKVGDGNDVAAIDAALAAAKAETSRPSLIAVRSHIGYGAPHKQDTAAAHGEPLGPDEVKAAKENLGWPLEPDFLVPDEVRAAFAVVGERGAATQARWEQRLAGWRAAETELAGAWDRAWAREPAPGWDAGLPVYSAADGALATRSAAGAALNAIAPHVPTLMGGSGDLAPSTNTLLKTSVSFEAGCYEGRNLHFGVREHAMASSANGMSVHGGVRPYVATFFVFTDYFRPAMRLAALMRQPVIYVLTHDSIGLGEDGPTHQPIEHLAIWRATPGCTLIRPADANEAVEAWRIAVTHHGGPIALVLSRQKLPTLDREKYAPAAGVRRGAYVLADTGVGVPDLILLASGSEVQLALAAQERLSAEGVAVRVVSMASWELFRAQDAAYRETVLPSAVSARLAVEAGVGQGWREWVGDGGDVLCLERFGASAPGERVFAELGFTTDEVCRRARALIEA
jgi:transketolase